MISNIPKKEMKNFISIYWQMLREIEENTEHSKNILNKMLVEGGYNVLNSAGICQHRPRWENS